MIFVAEDLTASDIAGTSVTIGWTVTNRRVSHEYMVNYGTSQDSLDMESSTESTSSNPGTNESYEIDLTGLTPDTTYYYQVVTTTSEGFKFESDIETFTTLETGIVLISTLLLGM